MACKACEMRAQMARSVKFDAVGDIGQPVLMECIEDSCHSVTIKSVSACFRCGGLVTMVDWETCECDNTHAANHTVCRYCYAKQHGSC